MVGTVIAKVKGSSAGDDYTMPASDGASGTYLKTDGSGNLSFGAIASSGFNSIQKFTASGTWTRPTGITKVLIFVTGGGGAGTYRSGDLGQGGGAAGTAIRFIDVSSISTSTITIGAGGSGGTGSDPYNGTVGANSIWSDGTNTITGVGGGIGSSTGVPGEGSTPTCAPSATHDVIIVGGSGGGMSDGMGGASFWGNGTNARYSGAYLSPLTNNVFGAGGGGQRGAAGGGGGSGFIMVLEFK